MFFLVYLLVGLICAFIGAQWAKSKGLSSVTWGVLCGFFPIAVVALAVMSPSSEAPAAGQGQASSRWKILTEVDIDIAAAAAEARGLGPKYENLLASKYLALNDKQYLPALLDNLRQQAAVALASGEASLMSLVTPWGEVRYRPQPDGSVDVVEGMLTGKSFPSEAALRRRLGIA